MGRPTENPKDIVIRARITEKENQMLNECVEKLRMTKTDIIVKGIELIYEKLCN